MNKITGFDEVIKELTYRVQAGSIVFVEGRKGSGKTTLLQAMISRFKGKKRVIYVDCSNVKSFNIEEIMQKRYGIFGRLMRLNPKNMVLLADNVTELSKRNITVLQYFFDHNYMASIIFTGESYAKSKLPKSIKDRIGGRVVKVPKPTPAEAVEIAHQRFGWPVSDEIVKKIYKSSKSVADFIANCVKVGEYAEKNRINELDEKHLKEALRK
ncbi:AAA family ATPase [Candidatus Woesearchaeota archaeon]|nr:AAA family ATPase [Candidatus Woesearchaeota archaeon]